MNAREMFEKLGYSRLEKDYSTKNIKFFKGDLHKKNEIIFIMEDKSAVKREVDCLACVGGISIKRINVEELKAIIKQYEELGWLQNE